MINLLCYDLENLTIITNYGIGNREVACIVNQYLNKKHNLGINDFNKFETESFNLEKNLLFSITTDSITPVFQFPSNDKINLLKKVDIKQKTEKLRFLKWVDVVVEYSNQSKKTLEKIIKKEYTKPIIFLYNNFLSYFLNSLLKDVDKIKIPIETSYLNSNLFGDENTIKRLYWNSYIFHEYMELEDKKVSNLDISLTNKLNELNKILSIMDSRTDYATKLKTRKYFYKKLIHTLFIDFLKNKRKSNSNLTNWLSLTYPIIQTNSNVILYDINKNDTDIFMVINNLLKSEFVNTIESNEDDLKKDLLSIFEKSYELSWLYNNLFIADDILYNFLSKDSRNYKIK